ncbi:MAG: hypothetical protein ACKPKO_63050, partial [Candidatus Fonsibacter sp.]
DWFEECVANCGRLTVLIIKNIGSSKLREAFDTYLLGAGGLMGATDVPCGSLLFTDSLWGESALVHGKSPNPLRG